MKPAIIIGGATGSGKSDLAVAVGEAFNGVVINADSMQVYKGLEIISGAPSQTYYQRCPHKLFGFKPAWESFSVGAWLELALKEIEAAHDNNQLPIIVGGTGLYIRSLISGIDLMPEVSSKVRHSVQERINNQGLSAVYAQLAEFDPEIAAKIEPGDGQRITRAIEVYESTGKTLSKWQTGKAVTRPYNFLKIIFLPDRQIIYEICNTRVLKMLEVGLMKEMIRLKNLELAPDLPAMKALGVPHLLSYLYGRISQDQAIEGTQRATRNYVKRQFTWFQKQIIADLVVKEKFSNKNQSNIFSKISKFLLTNLA
ncbi:MAG: tRNA (adenosine(37)-N6)-dimethylallyltransferase MiaA [Alphaproteobacteria bacterium]